MTAARWGRPRRPCIDGVVDDGEVVAGVHVEGEEPPSETAPTR